MGSQQDLQALLRIMTTGRNKMPMLMAMSRIKQLQTANIKSVADLAGAELSTIAKAIGDDKAAKALQTAVKSPKAEPAPSKRKRSQFELEGEPQSPEAYEASLALPTAEDEEISKSTIYTNRAPLVLAFAVTLLKYTMPEQPPSSRLSLAQALVSANSKSKAASLGLTNKAEHDLTGQPKVRVMGREIPVLKRGGYEWKPPSAHIKIESGTDGHIVKAEPSHVEIEPESDFNVIKSEPDIDAENTWSVSKTVTLKKSTFVARSITIQSPSQARSKLQQLMRSNPELRDASHNMTAWRCGGIEECNDDGESGGGRHLLNLLRNLNLTDIFLVVTRWYGGVFLSTDRWRLMTEVANDSLSQRLRVTGTVTGEALWGLDMDAKGDTSGMPVHKPETARNYIMKAFASPPSTTKKTGVSLEREKEHNLGLLLGALDLLFRSWVNHISKEDLDRRAWSWYVQVRPEVQDGVAGWGGKGEVKLADILALRRAQ